jgi:hypothetical protein
LRGVLNEKARVGSGAGCAPTSVSIPVATTETRILPSSSGLNADPQMMLASASTQQAVHRPKGLAALQRFVSAVRANY